MEQLFLGAEVDFQAVVPNARAGQSELVLLSGLREEELVS